MEYGSDPCDPCDACGSQAFVTAVKDCRVLLFCGHHGLQFRDRLITEGWVVTDLRHLIEGHRAKPPVAV